MVRGANHDNGAVRKLAKRRSSNLLPLWVRLPPASLNQTCVGWALASLSGRNPPAFGLWRFDSVPTHFHSRRGAMLVFAVSLSSSPTRVQFPSASLACIRLGVMLVFTARPSTWPTRVRFPSGSLERRCGGTGRHATLRTSCPAGVGVRISPSSLNHCGWASAHSGLISLDSRVRPPDPRLALIRYANRQSEQAENL